MRREATSNDAIKAYSVAEVADIMNVHRQTVHRWIADGRLAVFDIGVPGKRSRLRVTVQDLQAFIDAGRVDGGSAA